MYFDRIASSSTAKQRKAGKQEGRRERYSIYGKSLYQVRGSLDRKGSREFGSGKISTTMLVDLNMKENPTSTSTSFPLSWKYRCDLRDVEICLNLDFKFQVSDLKANYSLNSSRLITQMQVK